MSETALAKHKLYYEDLPPRKYKLKEGKTMSKQATATPVATYSKSKSEHRKDVIIAMLITAIVAFAGGIYFQRTNEAEVRNAVTQAQAATVATEAKK